VAKKMARDHLKSRYRLKSASVAFSDLIENISPKTKYILVSYNDMGSSGDPRSQARISDHELRSALERRGRLKIYEKQFRQFTTGKSTNNNLKERLFFCQVMPRRHHRAAQSSKIQPSAKYIKSPLNYTGGKFRLLPQLSTHFPKHIYTFYDVFCGGANVGVNADAKQIICLDNSPQLIDLLDYIQATNFESLHQQLTAVSKKYNLSQSYAYGYEHYRADSSRGLGAYNKPNYMKLRAAYNQATDPKTKNILLLTLIFYGFNNQLRFNSRGEFNLPVGKRDYNGNSRKNLAQFSEVINRKAVNFKLADFRDLLKSDFAPDDFVYLDPPYLLGLATYNEAGGWSDKDETDLHRILTALDKKGVKFGLSNVIEHKGRRNDLLEKWAKQRGFKINQLDFHYHNSNYQSRAKLAVTREVLITNCYNAR
jgi:adenine-specific DNA-methyltransferase